MKCIKVRIERKRKEEIYKRRNAKMEVKEKEEKRKGR